MFPQLWHLLELLGIVTWGETADRVNAIFVLSTLTVNNSKSYHAILTNEPKI